MVKDYTTLDTQVGVIKNETVEHANTPTRIGTTLQDIVDKVKDNDNIKILTFTTDKPTTRLLVTENRKVGLELRYGAFREIYIGTTFDDTAWVLESNWKQIEIDNNSIIRDANGTKVDTQNLLTSTSATKPLSANQGKVLDEKITQLGADLSTNNSKVSYLLGVVETNISLGSRTFTNGDDFSSRNIGSNANPFKDGKIEINISGTQSNFAAIFDAYNHNNVLVSSSAVVNNIAGSTVKASLYYKDISDFFYVTIRLVYGVGNTGASFSINGVLYNSTKIDNIDSNISDIISDISDIDSSINVIDTRLDILEENANIINNDYLWGTRTFANGDDFNGKNIGTVISSLVNGKIKIDFVNSNFEGNVHVLVFDSTSALALTTGIYNISSINKSIIFDYVNTNPMYYIQIIVDSGDSSVGATINLYEHINNTITKKEIWNGLEIMFNNPLQYIKKEAGFASVIHSCGFIGDSLSSGTIERLTQLGTTYENDRYEYSWGQRLCKLLGIDGYNFSNGGQTSKGWCTNSYGSTDRTWNYASTNLKNAYIIAMGVNDSGGGNISTDVDINNYNNNEDTYAGWYAGIIQRLRSVNPNCYIFCMTLPVNESGKNEVIRDAVSLFDKCYLIDLEKYAPNFDDATFVLNYKQGSHLSAVGYQWFAYLVNTYVDWIIRNNYEDFKDISFVTPTHLVSGVVTYTGSKPAGLMFSSADGNFYCKINNDGSYNIYLVKGTYQIICTGYNINTTSIVVNGVDVVLNLSAS